MFKIKFPYTIKKNIIKQVPGEFAGNNHFFFFFNITNVPDSAFWLFLF